MKRYFIISLITIIVFGLIFYITMDTKNVFIYVKNESFDIPEVNLSISFDGKKFVDSTYKVAKVVTDYYVYQAKLEKGRHLLTVKAKTQNLTKSHVFILEDKKYIFIKYDYDKKSRETIEAEKDTLDSLITPRAIYISSRDLLSIDTRR